MAFPASQRTLAEALARVQSTANKIKMAVQRLRDESASQNVTREAFTGLQRSLQRSIDSWDLDTATPGLAAYAKDQFDDQNLDIAAEYSAMRAEAVNLRNWIFSNLPTDSGTGAVLLRQLNADGSFSPIEVTPAQSAGFRTAADAFIATIS